MCLGAAPEGSRKQSCTVTDKSYRPIHRAAEKTRHVALTWRVNLVDCF